LQAPLFVDHQNSPSASRCNASPSYVRDWFEICCLPALGSRSHAPGLLGQQCNDGFCHSDSTAGVEAARSYLFSAK